MKVIYEDNHIIIVFKESGEIVQGDKTGDEPLSDLVKAYLKQKYQKPGNVFLGVAHRLDRPVAGLVVFAKTSKALSRLNKMFAEGQVHKTYWAIVSRRPSFLGAEKNMAGHQPLTADGAWHTLEHWLVRNERQNKSYAYEHAVPQGKKAVLRCRAVGFTDRYALLEVNLLTGRHHQIRCQLATVGYPIRGDLKYGARRSNPDGSISLLSRQVQLVHPVSKATICVVSPLPHDTLWQALSASSQSPISDSLQNTE